MTNPAKKSSGHGGRRPGAGRKPKGFVRPSSIAGIDLKAALEQAPPADVETAAAQHARIAIETLVKQLTFGNSESAKIAAANAILDRGFGKPSVDVGGEPLLPFLSAPAAATPSTEIREQARKYANLAIAVLRKVADSGSSESARVSAAKALLDRGLGTVGPAKLPDEFGHRSLGKREEAAQAAKTAGVGRFATPEPPKAKKESMN